MPPAKIIETQPDFDELIEKLRGETLVAFDTESNSMHAYRERVCLIQVSTRKRDYIIDPLAFDDLSALADIFADPNIEKVFHAAEYDIMCLKRDFGFTFYNVFDTMMAARICGLSEFGLGVLVSRYADVRIDKSHQRDNWGKRPLPKASLRYAQMDTHYLPLLRDLFHDMLRSQGRMDEAHEAFIEICATPPAHQRHFDPNSFWHIGKPNMLNRQELIVLRELVIARENIAEKRNIPPYKVLSNKTLITVARRQPQTIPELKTIHGFAARKLRRYGPYILKAVRRGQKLNDLPRPPRPDSPDPVAADRYSALHTWRKERAIRRGVDSDIIISKQALWDIANRAPSTLDALSNIDGIGPWKLRTYGEEIINVLHESRQTEP